jgi:hypothetical protein
MLCNSAPRGMNDILGTEKMQGSEGTLPHPTLTLYHNNSESLFDKNYNFKG